MMTLDALRQHILGQTTTVTVGGVEYRIAKLGAVDGMEVNAVLSGLETTGEGDNRKIKHPADYVRYTALLVSKCLVDEHGQRPLDSDEGRLWLGRLPAPELTALEEAVVNWTVAKKN